MSLRTSSPALPAVLLAAVAIVSVSASSAGSAQHRAACAPRAAHTLARDRSVRVYSLPGSSPFARRTYACLLRTGATLRLPGGGQPTVAIESLSDFALAETVLGYAQSSFGVDSGCTGITVLDVAHRHTLRSLPEVGCTVDAGFVQVGNVSGLVVTPRGSVAWIVSRGRHGAESFAVHDAPASAPPALLDQGPAIAPFSLRISGSLLSWQDGTQHRSAQLR
jgi:hypothetical protein